MATEETPIWRVCFEEAWAAFQAGSVPVGAVFVDESGTVRWRGRNRISESRVDGGPKQVVAGSRLAHAEINCLVQAPPALFREMARGTLYTTLEPCPLCVGAVVMAGVRHVVYAARDGWAGATHLLQVPGYTASKQVRAEGPRSSWETASLALHTVRSLMSSQRPEDLLAAFGQHDPAAVALGRQWQRTGFLLGHRTLEEVLRAAGCDA